MLAPDTTESGSDQARLIAGLRAPAVFGGGCASVTVLETHISYVVLTGKFAYKIKKSVNLGFLDFTTLAARRHYCEQELALNRRLAPSLYLDVVAITGSVEAPAVAGAGTPIEYAVRMREFPQDALASRLLARNALGARDIDVLAARVAAFHARIAVASPGSAFGAPDDILRVAMQNFSQMRPLLSSPADLAQLDALAQWTAGEHKARRNAFRERQHGGFIRECHGDLHLGNMVRIGGEIVIFDCIEFNDSFRWIDVMSEVAFAVMDLHDRGRPDLGQRFLNAYLEMTGDYAGLPVLRFYLVFRALVRAKVACMRLAQLGADTAGKAAGAEYRGYIGLARSYAQTPHPAVVITHGLAGSGKTTLSQALLEAAGAVRIRTDVERKRGYGINPRAHMQAGIDRGLYAPEVTEETYCHVSTLVSQVVAAGGVAIVDGAFLRRWQRDLFRKLAASLQAPFLIVSFEAGEATLRKRIARRAARGGDASDADLAVLEHQLRSQEPLSPEERADTVRFDAEIPLKRARTPEAWRAVVERIRDSTISGTAPKALAGADHAAGAGLTERDSAYKYP